MSRTGAREAFYVGYQDRAPAVLGRFLRRVVLLLILAAIGVAVLLVVLQAPFDPGVFEFGVVKRYQGVLVEDPVPLLVIDQPVGVGGEITSRFLLVAFGKQGAEPEIEGLAGQEVRLDGSLIYREGVAMLELVAGSVEALPPGGSAQEGPPAAPLAAPIDLGRQTLRGEIVDSKCFLGVMKPGRGKPHRACAVRCISGGVPPVLRVETRDGDFRHFLLADENGDRVNDRVLEFVAEPIEITGEVRRLGELLILAADPRDYRRL